MARPILMPQVGQDLTEGKLTALSVKVGDTVKKGDIVAEVESEKAVFEVEAFETGTILEIRYAVGDMAVVLEPLMLVGEAGEVLAGAPAPAAFEGEDAEAIVVNAAGMAPAAQMPATLAGAPVPAVPVQAGGSSPLARRLAASAGIDLRAVAGSGPRGAVVRRDIEAFRRGDDPSARASSVVAFAGGPARSPSSGALPLQQLRAGTGDPVLLVHGFGGELSAWRPFVMHLSLPNPVLALDLPAHGGASETVASGFDEVVAAVRATLAEERLERLHIVGHSLGASVAAEIAGGGDLDMRSLSLLSPAGLGPKINGDYLSGFLSSTTEASLKVWLELLVSDPAALPGVLVRATLAGRENGALARNQARLAAGLFSGNTQLFSIREALARFAGPLRVIVGCNDLIIPADHGDSLPPQAALHRLPGVGHLPQLEAGALVGRLVAEAVRSAG